METHPNSDLQNIHSLRYVLQTNQTPFNLTENDLEWIYSTFSLMTLEEKVGQLLVPQDYELNKKNLAKDLLIKPGGFFLGMGGNWRKKQKKRSLYAQQNSKIPLLICGDLEFGALGGAINATPFHTEMGIAATNNKLNAERLAEIVAVEGKEMGYNWNLSPVVDINYNHLNSIVNARSFGDDPIKVENLSLAYLKKIQEFNFAACAKHFPGDGCDYRDQHLVTSVNTSTWEEWMNTFGKIYKSMIDNGLRTIMAAHIALPSAYSHFSELLNSLEEDSIQKKELEKIFQSDINSNVTDGKYTPGTLSTLLSTYVLRTVLNFKGIVVSDATGMLGLLSHGKREDLLPQLINSGSDIQLFTHNTLGDFQILLNAVKKGIISQERLNEAVGRILALKASLKLHLEDYHAAESHFISKEQREKHSKWALECARKSITVLKDEQKLLPISLDRYKTIGILKGGEMPIILYRIKRELKKRGFKVRILKNTSEISKNDVVIYCPIEPPFAGRNQIRMRWKELGGLSWIAPKVPTIMISFGSPYHIYDVPKISTFLNAYAPFPQVQQAVVEVLTGEITAQGTSPVEFRDFEDPVGFSPMESLK